MSAQVREGIREDESSYRVSAILDDVGGLVQNSRVMIAGIPVGQIEQIELEGERARIWLVLDLPTPLLSDTRLVKRSAGLLGENFISLSPGQSGAPVLSGGQLHQVHQEVGPTELMEDVREIFVDVREITRSLKRVIASQRGEARLNEIIESVNSIVAQVDRSFGESVSKFDQVLDNVIAITGDARSFTGDFREKADQILSDAGEVAKNSREITRSVQALIDGEGDGPRQERGMRRALQTLQSNLDRLDRTLGSAESIAEKIDRGDGTLGQLVNDDRLGRSVTELLDESGRFIRRLTRLQFWVSMRSEYYVSRAVNKNYFSIRLQPKPDKYYLLQLSDAPRGRVRIIDQTTTTGTGSDARSVQERRETIEDEFLISLQFAKRWHFATGRVGVMEDSGGLGLDLDFFQDRLNLTTDLFRFAAGRNPNLRIRASVEFFTHLFIAGGIDDALNEERDLFIGAGLRFNDEDLQAILTAAPVPSL